MPDNQSSQIRPKHIIAAVLFAIFVLVLFNVQTQSDETSPVEISTLSEPPKSLETPRFPSASIEAAKLEISKDSNVIDLLYDEANAIEWHVALADDGTRRYGYAEAVCIILRQHGAYDDDVAVRIVDAAKRAEFKDAYRDYSLGAIQCRDSQRLD